MYYIRVSDLNKRKLNQLISLGQRFRVCTEDELLALEEKEEEYQFSESLKDLLAEMT